MHIYYLHQALHQYNGIPTFLVMLLKFQSWKSSELRTKIQIYRTYSYLNGVFLSTTLSASRKLISFIKLMFEQMKLLNLF